MNRPVFFFLPQNAFSATMSHSANARIFYFYTNGQDTDHIIFRYLMSFYFILFYLFIYLFFSQENSNSQISSIDIISTKKKKKKKNRNLDTHSSKFNILKEIKGTDHEYNRIPQPALDAKWKWNTQFRRHNIRAAGAESQEDSSYPADGHQAIINKMNKKP